VTESDELPILPIETDCDIAPQVTLISDGTRNDEALLGIPEAALRSSGKLWTI